MLQIITLYFLAKLFCLQMQNYAFLFHLIKLTFCFFMEVEVSLVPFLFPWISQSVQSLGRVRLLRPCGLWHAKLPCPSPTPGASSNSCPSSRWHHSTISSSLVLFSSHLQSFPASGSSPMSQFFASGGQSIGVSASVSVIPMNIQDWFPLGWIGWIS